MTEKKQSALVLEGGGTRAFYCRSAGPLDGKGVEFPYVIRGVGRSLQCGGFCVWSDRAHQEMYDL